MRLINICSGIEWDSDKVVFIPKSDEYHLYSDYLNSIYPSCLESETKLIEDFLQSIEDKSQSEIEELIIRDLEGFLFIDEKPFAKIAGANDLAPAVLYDFKDKNITIYHPNTKRQLSNNISFEDLLSVLAKARSIAENLVV